MNHHLLHPQHPQHHPQSHPNLASSPSSRPSTRDRPTRQSSEPQQLSLGSGARQFRRKKANPAERSPRADRPDRPDRPAAMEKSNHSRKRSSSATGSPFVASASPFLQHLINEQRAVRGSRESSRTTPSDRASTDDSRPQTPTTPAAAAATSQSYSQTDLSSEQQRKVTNVLSAGLKQPEDMGVREMDQYVHKLNKLNFDLKLEIFHRAQQIAALNRKVEHVHELEEQVQQIPRLEEELQTLRDVEESNQRLQESNENLQSELDKRDQAVGEAVDLICELEAKVDELQSQTESYAQPAPADPQQECTALPSPESSPETGTLTPKSRVVLDVPDRTSSRKGTRCPSTASHHSHHNHHHHRTESSGATTPTTTHPQARRQPSFLRDQKESTSALRSVYLADGALKSRGALSVASHGETTTAPSASDVDDRHRPDSPNLSTLSECSYLDPSKSPTRQLRPDLPSIIPSQTAADTTQPQPSPRKDASTTSYEHARPGTLSRVQQWIHQPHANNQTQQSLTHTPPRDTNKQPERTGVKPSLAPAFHAAEPPAEKSNKLLQTPTVEPAQLFSNGRFPPTPDTMSTSHANTIRNGSNTSVVAEKSHYDRLYTPLHVERRGGRAARRPRSADELATRPSTAASTDDSLEAADPSSHNGFGAGGEDQRLANMFPSYHTPRQKVSNSSPVQYEKSPGHADNHGDVYNVIQTHDNDTHKQIDTNNLATSNSSPPLTPQDWLDAAIPAPESRRNNNDTYMSPQKTPSKSTADHRVEIDDHHHPHEPGLPPPVALRTRAPGSNANGSNNSRSVSGARRLLNFRLFSRSSPSSTNRDGAQTPAETSEDRYDSPATPITRMARRASTSLRRSINVDLPSSGEMIPVDDDNNINHTDTDDCLHKYRHPTATDDASADPHASKKSTLRPFTPSAPPPSGQMPRPCTAGSLETGGGRRRSRSNSARRRSSHGFFGWIRGATTTKDTDPNNHSNPSNHNNTLSFSSPATGPAAAAAPAMIAPHALHPSSTPSSMQKTAKSRGAPRSCSALGHVSDAAYSVVVSGPGPERGAEEGRKSKLPPRRFRKG